MKKSAKAIQKTILLTTSLAVMVGIFMSVLAVTTRPAASAQTNFQNSDPKSQCPPGQYTVEKNPNATNFTPCTTNRAIAIDKSKTGSAANCTIDCGGIISKIVNPLINTMTAIVGLIIAISLVVGAITYSAAGGDPSKVAAAKKRITNSIIALVAYLFTFGLLQWLVPGGII